MRDTKVKGDTNARFKAYGTKTCIHCQILKALLKGEPSGQEVLRVLEVRTHNQYDRRVFVGFYRVCHLSFPNTLISKTKVARVMLGLHKFTV